MQIELLMKCCHENVQGWSPIFFLLLKKFGEFECILQWKKCFLLQERIGKKASNFFFWIQERSAKKFSFQVHVNYNVQIILRKPLWEDFHYELYMVALQTGKM